MELHVLHGWASGELRTETSGRSVSRLDKTRVIVRELEAVGNGNGNDGIGEILGDGDEGGKLSGVSRAV